MKLTNRSNLVSQAAFLALLTTPLLAVAGETRRIEGLDLTKVDEIYLLGAAKAEIRQGDDTELQVRGSEEDLDKEPFFVKGNSLILGKSRKHRNNFNDVRFRVVVPDLQELKVKGSGSAWVKPFRLMERDQGGPPTVEVEGSGEIKLYGIEGPAIELRVNGSGDIKAVDIDVAEIEAVIAGSGDLYVQKLQAKDGEFVVTGTGDLTVVDESFVHTLEVSVVGSGDARLSDVTCERAEVNVVGSGSAVIGEVLEQLNASILGSGDIRYAGEPEVESVELGSGNIRARN